MWILSLLLLAATIYAVVDIVLRDDAEVKRLPRVVWLLLVVLIPVLGVVLWFTAGRVYAERGIRSDRVATRPVTPTTAAAAGRDTRSTEQQLADLEREIEEERLRAEIARKRAERDGPGEG